MQVWTDELHRLGFRHKRHRYWRCDRGFGLDADAHLSLFLWTRHAGDREAGCYEVCEFHVTFCLAGHHLHFYYHEIGENRWARGGHTTRAEIELLGLDFVQLAEDAERIAARLAEAMGGRLKELPD